MQVCSSLSSPSAVKDAPPSRQLQYKMCVSSSNIKHAIQEKIEERIQRLSDADFRLIQDELKKRSHCFIVYELPRENNRIQEYFRQPAYLFVYDDQREWEAAKAQGHATILRLLIQDHRVTAAAMVPCTHNNDEFLATPLGEIEKACQTLLKLFGA